MKSHGIPCGIHAVADPSNIQKPLMRLAYRRHTSDQSSTMEAFHENFPGETTIKICRFP